MYCTGCTCTCIHVYTDVCVLYALYILCHDCMPLYIYIYIYILISRTLLNFFLPTVSPSSLTPSFLHSLPLLLPLHFSSSSFLLPPSFPHSLSLPPFLLFVPSSLPIYLHVYLHTVPSPSPHLLSLPFPLIQASHYEHATLLELIRTEHKVQITRTLVPFIVSSIC